MNGTELAKVPEFFFALVLMLGVVITVHEFGHFLVAKLCGVRVLKFSIGFGPPIGFGRFRMAWTRGGTDYVIAWFPLGGFVKMLGELPAELDEPDVIAHPSETLEAKPTWQKLAILFAGPAMNLLLPVVVFTGSLMVGIERPEAVVGTVEPGSPAAAAGVRPGDRVTVVAGEPVQWWSDVEAALRSAGGRQVALEVERGGESLPVEIAVAERVGLDEFRATLDVGWAGLQHERQQAVVGITDAGSPASLAGLRSGDRVKAVGDTEVADWPGFVRAYAAAADPATLRVERRKAVDAEPGDPPPSEGAAAQEPSGEDPAAAADSLVIQVPALGDPRALGVIPAVVLVSQVEPDSAASEAGLEAGDLVVAVDGLPIGSFFTFKETVMASEGRPLEILVARKGGTRQLRLAPRLMKTDVGGVEEDLYRIGIQGQNAILRGATAIDRETNPLRAVPRAAVMTADITRLFLRGLKKLVSGEISRKNVGGPIEIARQSHTALQAGWDIFLRLLVLISINVGILNLLPIPVLDGGQALMVAIEGVKRSPLSLRTRETVQQIGIVLLLMIMGMAFWNDLSRNWSSFVEWLQGL